MNNYESLLPNKKALFDIPVARTASAYLTSLLLAVSAFVADGSFNGGDNALWVLFIIPSPEALLCPITVFSLVKKKRKLNLINI